MGVTLAKNDKVNLSKSSSGLKRVFMGLGWDVVKKKSGFFSNIFGSEGDGDIDLDASCLMFDSNKSLVDTVWFRKLRSSDGSIVHNGDNLTGDGDGDDEVIDVDLTKVPSNVQSLVFVITSFRGQTFEKVESAFCRIVNADNEVELAKYNLSGKNAYTGQVMAKLYRENGEWMMHAIGEPGNGSTQSELLPLALRYL